MDYGWQMRDDGGCKMDYRWMIEDGWWMIGYGWRMINEGWWMTEDTL